MINNYYNLFSIKMSVEANVRKFLKQMLGIELFLQNTTAIPLAYFERNVRSTIKAPLTLHFVII